MFKQKSDSSAQTAQVESADAVQAARTRARHRLIGAIVLLAIGIIGFPLVFETQPRPVPIDIPIEIPRRDSMPPLAVPQSRPGPSQDATAARVAPRTDAIAIESRAEAGRDVTPAPAPADRSASRVAAAAVPPAAASEPTRRAAVTEPARKASAVEPARRASAAEPARRASAPVLAARPAEAEAGAARSESDRAQALLEGRPGAAAEGARFILQVGAFADAEAARDTRKQVERLGLKTYTQVAQTPSGSRIRVRVGPFASRGEADAALAKAKAAGLAAVVLTL
ncbi:MAG TPA: SPOR domain-containing protein [Caldimonas sp.]|jgi:DedD protein|nr:SPOR domain-containing protein [Caldimonas sp.]HEX2540268.1 SPOR domain-containing protein [Caldimonas sp.]